MGAGFGFDFSRVRIHTDQRAAESAQAVDALAYTVGSDIVFGSGRYTPGQAAGRRLIAHELAHVIQQDATAGVAARKPELAVSDPGDSHEQAADLAAAEVAQGVGSDRPIVRVHACRGHRGVLQRQFSREPPAASHDPVTLRDDELVETYRRVLSANDPRLAGYLVLLEAELTLRVQAEIRRQQAARTTRAGTAPPVAQAGIPAPAAIALALRLLLGSGTAAPTIGGAAATVTQTAGAVGATATGEALLAGATGEVIGTQVARTVAGEAVATAAAEEGVLATAGSRLVLGLSTVAIAVTVLLWPSPLGSGTRPEPPRRQEENRRRLGCRQRFPQAIPIRWPPPVWHTQNLGDPGSQDTRFDYPETPLLISYGSELYEESRPENDRYRTRVSNPPFRIRIPFGYHVHHKWPLSLGGPGSIPAMSGGPSSSRVSQLPEGEYTAEGEIVSSPNLVLMSAALHQAWHAFLAEQPQGPSFGQGPGPLTPNDTQFCVLDLV